MKNVKNAELLNRADVIEEIKRHLWIESEKHGRDIGFEKAAEEWMKFHVPAKACSPKVAPCAPVKKEEAKPAGKVAAPRKRSAKSYF